MTTLILIRGLPGSGKSTLAQHYAAQGYCHIEADMFFIGPDGAYQYDASRSGEAHSWCLCETIAALAQGRNVVVANTFTRRYELASYQAIAAALGVHVEIVVATGTYANVHAVPDATLAAMQARWED